MTSPLVDKLLLMPIRARPEDVGASDDLQDELLTLVHFHILLEDSHHKAVPLMSGLTPKSFLALGDSLTSILDGVD